MNEMSTDIDNSKRELLTKGRLDAFTLMKDTAIVLSVLTVFQLYLMLSPLEGYTPYNAPYLYVVMIAMLLLLSIPLLVWFLGSPSKSPWALASIIAAVVLIAYFWIFFIFFLAPAILEFMTYSRSPERPKGQSNNL